MRCALAGILMGLLAAQAQAASLSSAGADLGRVKAATLTNGLTLEVTLGDDAPLAAHVIARFQNNQPLMLGHDGLWAPWDGRAEALDEAGAEITEGKMRLRLLETLPGGLFYPVAFTLIYDTAAGPKNGTLVLDGP